MNDNSSLKDFYKNRLSRNDFDRLSRFVHSHVGISLPWSKMSMLESRLRKRLRKLNINRFSDYCDFLFSQRGIEEEMAFFINVITTNKTEFFRESGHFEYLVQKAVPELVAGKGSGINRKLNVWSAASSKGNEVYTLAIVLSEFAARYPGLNFDFFILGTDISTEMLEQAKTGVYKQEDIEAVPADLRKKYFLRSKDPDKNLVRVVPALRSRVRFRQQNLMDHDFRLREAMDIIFCRNVIIYFDKQTQQDLVSRLCRHLRHGGYLFMGHSEVLDCRDFPLVATAPAVYRRVE